MMAALIPRLKAVGIPAAGRNGSSPLSPTLFLSDRLFYNLQPIVCLAIGFSLYIISLNATLLTLYSNK